MNKPTKKTNSKTNKPVSKKQSTVDGFEPTKVALMVASLAATSLVLMAVVAVSSL